MEPKSPSAESPDHVSLLSQGRKGEDLPEESENFRAKSRLIIFFLIFQRARVVTSKYFSAFTAQYELLCRNREKIRFFKSYGFYQKPVSITESSC